TSASTTTLPTAKPPTDAVQRARFVASVGSGSRAATRAATAMGGLLATVARPADLARVRRVARSEAAAVQRARTRIAAVAVPPPAAPISRALLSATTLERRYLLAVAQISVLRPKDAL